MKLLDEPAFNHACGNMIPFHRFVPSLIGQTYHCACGHLHEITSLDLIRGEGAQGHLLVSCPHDPTAITLLQAKCRWVQVFDRLDTVAGYRNEKA